jgi:hypothetical protein
LTFDFVEFDEDNEENITSPLIAGMGVSYDSEVDANFKITTKNTDKIDLNITYATPKGYGDIESSEIVKFFEDNKSSVISSFAHELMHSFEREVSPNETIKRRSRYSVQSSFRTPVTSINEFLYALYFTNEVENYVRASETYTYLKKLGTTEKDFLNNLNSYDTIKKLLKYRNYTYEDLKQSLRNDMEGVNEFLSYIKGYPKKIETDEEKVDAVLDISHDLFMNDVLKNVQEIGSKALAQTNPFQLFMSMLSGEITDDKGLRKIMKDSTKFRDDYNKWYEYEIKKMNRVADEMYRKLVKIYSLMKKEETPTIKTEIFDPTSFEIEEFMRKNKKK